MREVEKNVIGSACCLSRLLVPKDQVNPVMQVLGNKFTLKRQSMQSNKFFWGPVGPSWKGYIADSSTVLSALVLTWKAHETRVEGIFGKCMSTPKKKLMLLNEPESAQSQIHCDCAKIQGCHRTQAAALSPLKYLSNSSSRFLRLRKTVGP